MSPSVNNGSSSLLIIFVFTFFLFLTPLTSAFNITKLLDRYSGYGTLNSLLSQTKLANEINRRKTITVLAVPDPQISGLSSKGADTAKRVLSNHVILDYYDVDKLHNLKNGKAMLVTLYQSSGEASDQKGFLNVTSKDGEVKFGVAAKGAPHDVTLIKLVAAQPYNISVLAVSGPILALGIDAGPAGPPLKPEAPAPTAYKKKKKRSPSPSPMEAEGPDEAEAASPADGPAEKSTDAPVPAPASGPADADAPADGSKDSGPSVDEEKDEYADSPADNSKGTKENGFADSLFVGLVVSLVSLLLVQQWSL